MKSITLIFDDELSEEVNKKIIPLFENHLKITVPYSKCKDFAFGENEFLVFYISDQQFRDLIETVIEKHLKMGFLPHPRLEEVAQGFGVSSSLEVGVENILQTEETVEMDVLYANGQPVFNSMAIGNTFSLLHAGDLGKKGFFKYFFHLKIFFSTLKRAKLHDLKLNWSTESSEKREKDLETAILGMVVVQHGKSSILSRRVLEDSDPNDGMMNCLILAPQSIWEVLKFGLYNIFKSSKSQKLPSYVAHLKTDKVYVSSKQNIDFAIDNILISAKEIVLEVKPKQINVVPGKFLLTKRDVDTKRIIKVQNLPQGELRYELLQRNLPLTNHATAEEFKWLFTILRENSRLNSSYLVLMALATIIATFGLFGNSTPVIIGAMILAPLMAPIISLAMGVLRQDQNLIKNSFITIGVGMALGYVFAILITWFTPLNSLNSEILARIRPNLLDLGVAAASGVAGAYAHAKKEIAKTLAGVAIAVALVPPLAVSGIGFGWGDWSVFWGALLLLGTNLAGMVLAAALTFLVLGFSPFRLAQKGLMISLFFVALISAPLALGFTEMVKENKLIQKLAGQEIKQGKLRDIHVLQMSPIRLSMTVVSESPLDIHELEEVKQEIEAIVGEEIEIELSVAIKF
ncbi:TIGR00341 family protein [Fontibacter flavus]|uniref:TIGR00341 family protein n=1 Tax=Fontibacter flavus TaxID=654838 RepID=A0ABV6FXR5_9BACT